MINTTLTKIRFRASFRDPEMKLWIFTFPSLLYLILSAIFMNIGSDGLHFQVALLDRTGWQERVTQAEDEFTYRGSQILHTVFQELSQAEEGAKPLFSFVMVKDQDEAIEMLRMEKVSLFVEIPEDFNQRFNQILYLGGLLGDRLSPPLVHIHRTSARQYSQTASEIMEQVLLGINLEAAREVQWELVHIEREIEVLGRAEGFSYPQFLLVSVSLMTILMVGVFYMGYYLAWFRTQGALKSFLVTPMKPSSFIFSLIVEQFITIVCAVLLLVLVANLKDRIGFQIFAPKSLVFLFLMVMTSMSLGTLIGAISKTEKAAESLANFLFFPLIFLGGSFVVGGGFPAPLQWAMNVNPLTWIGFGIRHEMGVMTSPYTEQFFLHYLVPLIWIGITLGISVRKLRLGVE